MVGTSDMAWFKQRFTAPIHAAIAGTPFSLDMITALACQETGEVWPILRRKPELTTARILELCVGDTLDDTRGRKAFPKNKDDLLSKPRGDEMFAVARQALVDMAAHIKSYQGAAKNPNKFCHGFGIFQFDLQFFLEEPDYFLERRYADFGNSLRHCLKELNRGLKKIGLQDRPALSDDESAFVAIAYNTGRFNPAKGLKQGFKSGDKFYGEMIKEFIERAHTVA